MSLFGKDCAHRLSNFPCDRYFRTDPSFLFFFRAYFFLLDLPKMLSLQGGNSPPASLITSTFSNFAVYPPPIPSDLEKEIFPKKKPSLLPSLPSLDKEPLRDFFVPTPQILPKVEKPTIPSIFEHHFLDDLIYHKIPPTMLQSRIENMVKDWDNETISQCLCYFHTRYDRLIPIDLFPPATIFNFKKKIISLLKDKKAALEGEAIEGGLPFFCSEENYRRHLKNATVFPIFIWYHPVPKTHQQTMSMMQELGIQGVIGSSHWVIVIVDTATRFITYFDSLYSYIASPDEMLEILTPLAKELDIIYPASDGAEFFARIAANEVIQRHSGSSCGPWCCQFLQWYLEDPFVNPSDLISKNVEESYENLASFVQFCKKAMSPFSDLSWPSIDE